MTKREENRVTMFKAVQHFLRQNLEKLSVIPVFAEVLETLDQSIDDIDARNDEHQTVAEGATDQKRDAEEELVAETVALCRPAYTYAKRAGNRELQARFKVTESELDHLRDTELLNRVQSLNDLLEEHQEDLAGYGVTPEKITAHREQVDAYRQALGNKEALSAVKVAARDALTDAIARTNEILKEEIDPLMALFRTTDKQFYDQYHAVRVIKDL